MAAPPALGCDAFEPRMITLRARTGATRKYPIGYAPIRHAAKRRYAWNQPTTFHPSLGGTFCISSRCRTSRGRFVPDADGAPSASIPGASRDAGRCPSRHRSYTRRIPLLALDEAHLNTGWFHSKQVRSIGRGRRGTFNREAARRDGVVRPGDIQHGDSRADPHYALTSGDAGQPSTFSGLF